MSRDLRADIANPVSLGDMYDSAVQIARELLAVDAGHFPKIADPATWRNVVFCRKGLGSRLARIFPSIVANKPALVDLRDAHGERLVQCIDVGFGIVFSPTSQPTSVVFTVCLALAAAKIGSGKFINYELWPKAAFPEDPAEFIAATRIAARRAAFHTASASFLNSLDSIGSDDALLK